MRKTHFRPSLFALEDRLAPAGVTWALSGDGDFNVAGNWNVDGTNPIQHRVPGSSDDASIGGNWVVTSSASQTVNSISANGLQITGGTFSTLNVNHDSGISNVVVAAGATLQASGQTLFIVGGELAGTLNAAAGATLRFLRGTNNFNPGVTLTGPGKFLTQGDVNGGPGVVLNTAVTLPADFDLTNGVVSGPGSLVVPNGVGFDFTGGSFSGDGILQVNAGGSVNASGGTEKIFDPQWTINNAGTVTVSGTGGMKMNTGVTFNNKPTGVVNLNTNSGFTYGGGVFNNEGLFVFTSPTGVGTAPFGHALNNTGTVRVDVGTLSVFGGGTSTGLFNLNGGNFTFSNGSPVLNNGASASGTGTMTLSGGTLNVFGAASAARFNQSGGYLGGTGTLTVTTQGNFSGGFMGDGGKTVIGAGAAFTISGATERGLDPNRQFENFGTVTQTGLGGFRLNTGALVTNKAGATFDLQVDSSFSYGGGTVVNEGTFKKSAGSGTFTINHAFNNAGTLQVQSGTLALTAGGISTGAFTLTGGNLTFGNGSSTLAAGVTVTGTGTFGLSGGTLSVTGAVSVPRFDQSGGLLNGTGTLTVTTQGNYSGGFMGDGGKTVVGAGAAFTISGAVERGLDINRQFDNFGTVTQTGTGGFRLIAGAVFTNKPGATFDAQVDGSFSYGGGSVVNEGTFKKSAGPGTFLEPHAFTNSGTLLVQSGKLYFASYTQTGGTASVSAGATLQANAFTLVGGTLGGAGTVQADVVNAGGTVSPGGTGTVGTLTITGNYTQQAGGTTLIEIAGLGAGQADKLIVSGAATLAGSMNFLLIGGYTLNGQISYQPVTFASRSGTFGTISAPAGGAVATTYAATNVSVVITPSATAAVFRWAGRLYQDLLGRAGSDAEINLYANLNLSGLTRATIATFFTTSFEFRTRQVRALYQTYLNRQPDGAGLDFYVNRLISGERLEDLSISFVASAEYFQASGGTAAGYINAAFQSILLRPAGPADITFYTPQVNAGNRTSLPKSLYGSLEYRDRLVITIYQTYLGRVPAPSEVNYYSAQLASGLRQEQIIAPFLASDEYFNKP